MICMCACMQVATLETTDLVKILDVAFQWQLHRVITIFSQPMAYARSTVTWRGPTVEEREAG